jgi:hypothetical protein
MNTTREAWPTELRLKDKTIEVIGMPALTDIAQAAPNREALETMVAEAKGFDS